MNELEELRKILDSDETIALSIKPNKKRFTFLSIIGTIPLLLFSLPFLIVGILGLVGVIQFMQEGGGVSLLGPGVMFGVGLLVTIIWITNIASVFVRYKRCVYVVTNKRLIVRSGFVGVDYKSLELSQATAMTVRVDFLDKLVKPNTGTITFGSASMPMVTDRNGRVVPYAFAHIDDPYENYKKIQSLMGK